MSINIEAISGRLAAEEKRAFWASYDHLALVRNDIPDLLALVSHLQSTVQRAWEVGEHRATEVQRLQSAPARMKWLEEQLSVMDPSEFIERSPVKTFSVDGGESFHLTLGEAIDAELGAK